MWRVDSGVSVDNLSETGNHHEQRERCQIHWEMPVWHHASAKLLIHINDSWEEWVLSLIYWCVHCQHQVLDWKIPLPLTSSHAHTGKKWSCAVCLRNSRLSQIPSIPECPVCLRSLCLSVLDRPSLQSVSGALVHFRYSRQSQNCLSHRTDAGSPHLFVRGPTQSVTGPPSFCLRSSCLSHPPPHLSQAHHLPGLSEQPPPSAPPHTWLLRNEATLECVPSWFRGSEDVDSDHLPT